MSTVLALVPRAVAPAALGALVKPRAEMPLALHPRREVEERREGLRYALGAGLDELFHHAATIPSWWSCIRLLSSQIEKTGMGAIRAAGRALDGSDRSVLTGGISGRQVADRVKGELVIRKDRRLNWRWPAVATLVRATGLEWGEEVDDEVLTLDPEFRRRLVDGHGTGG